MYGKKTYRFYNLRKLKDFNKKQLTLLKMCVTSLLCGPRANLWPFYGFLCKRFSLYIKTHKSACGPHGRDVTHILSKVSCFLLKSFLFVGYRNDRFFSHTNPYILNVTQQCRCSYFELGLPVPDHYQINYNT